MEPCQFAAPLQSPIVWSRPQEGGLSRYILRGLPSIAPYHRQALPAGLRSLFSAKASPPASGGCPPESVTRPRGYAATKFTSHVPARHELRRAVPADRT